MLTSAVSLVIVVGVVAVVVFLVRYAIREAEGKDPRWGLVGRLQVGSPIADLGPKLFVIPTQRGLLLRSSSHREAEWERVYPWPSVHVDEVDGAVRVGGPFGIILCGVGSEGSVGESINRMRPSSDPPF